MKSLKFQRLFFSIACVCLVLFAGIMLVGCSNKDNESEDNAIYHTVTYFDEDQTTVLSYVSVKEGSPAVYDKSAPTKQENNTYFYTFEDWTDANGVVANISSVKADMSVYAKYSQQYREYTITFPSQVLVMKQNSAMLSGDKLHYGDIISISYNQTVGYTKSLFQINGKDSVNKTAYTVQGNVSIVYQETKDSSSEPDPIPTENYYSLKTTGAYTCEKCEHSDGTVSDWAYFQYIKVNSNNSLKFGAYINEESIPGNFYEIDNLAYTQNKNTITMTIAFGGTQIPVTAELLDARTFKAKFNENYYYFSWHEDFNVLLDATSEKLYKEIYALRGTAVIDEDYDINWTVKSDKTIICEIAPKANPTEKFSETLNYNVYGNMIVVVDGDGDIFFGRIVFNDNTLVVIGEYTYQNSDGSEMFVDTFIYVFEI